MNFFGRCFLLLPLALGLGTPETGGAVQDQPPSAAAHHHDASPVAGPDFTDPLLQAETNAEWQQQSIVYDEWSANADLAITFDQQIYQMLEPVALAYAREHGLKVAVREGTCGISAGMLTRKQVDMAAFCCPPAQTDRLPDLAFHTIGIAAVAFLTHPDIPVEGVSLAELRAIFQGDRFYWSEVQHSEGRPGPRLPIQAMGRLHCKLRPGHWRLMLNDSDRFSHRMQEVGTIPDMVFNVVTTPGAIGHETLWHVERFGDKGRPRVLRIDGVDPANLEEVARGRYPVYRVFNVTTWERDDLRNSHAAALVKKMIQAADSMDPRFGLVPVSRLRAAGWKFHHNEVVAPPDAP